MPSLGIAGAVSTSWDIFSSNVSLETRSSTLWLMGSLVWQKGYNFVDGSDESHEYGGCVDSTYKWSEVVWMAMRMRILRHKFWSLIL